MILVTIFSEPKLVFYIFQLTASPKAVKMHCFDWGRHPYYLLLLLTPKKKLKIKKSPINHLESLINKIYS